MTDTYYTCPKCKRKTVYKGMCNCILPKLNKEQICGYCGYEKCICQYDESGMLKGD